LANGTKLGSKHLCKVLYNVSSFRSLPAKFGSIWISCFREDFLIALADQKKEIILAAMSVGRMKSNEEAL
jgi:hypothetical protein